MNRAELGLLWRRLRRYWSIVIPWRMRRLHSRRPLVADVTPSTALSGVNAGHAPILTNRQIKNVVECDRPPRETFVKTAQALGLVGEGATVEEALSAIEKATLNQSIGIRKNLFYGALAGTSYAVHQDPVTAKPEATGTLNVMTGAYQYAGKWE